MQPGLSIMIDPLRIRAVGVLQDGSAVALEFPITVQQASEFAIHLARAAAGEAGKIEEFDREFLAGMKVKMACAN